MAGIITLTTDFGSRDAAGHLVGRVVHVDGFGNLITDIREGDLPGERLIIEVAGRRIERLSSSYAGGGGLAALIGSSGYLEIAAASADASRLLGVGVGAPVSLISPPA